ncbi:MAG: glycine--tRNA ligase subunit beta [candidate division WOR-3 bacterium]|nr:glycine--tRNA ligase subunit beta [candidate division WOR-3 bacterium]
MKQLLLEIGTEEIPASFLKPAALDLERRVRAALAESDIPAGVSELFSTPRRLALRLSDVADGRPAQVVELQGPPRKAAFDAQGNPTRTAVGFSAAHGKTPADLYFKQTPRGEYVFLKKQTDPLPTTKVLQERLPGIITALPFPKNMRWDASGLRFARPIRWLVCLFGPDAVEFTLGELKSGADSRGLRNSKPPHFRVPSPAEYETELKAHGVIASHDARRKTIAAELLRLAGTVSGQPVEDDELLDETTDITESPELLLCSFNPDYLSLPGEVLVTALKKHQRCFSVRGDCPQTGTAPEAESPLLPRFVAVTNTPGCDHAVVTGWYEKAAESRLRDARFFVESDLKHGLEALVDEEKQVTWIEGMGTYFDKTQRLRELCRHLTAQTPNTDAIALDRAALLCKADLLTNMVREKEFTSLQGRIGGIYARTMGEPPSVADAIAEHYLPRFIGDKLPATRNGALLSIADKLDNIVATFLSGEIPTGSEDPFALRRQSTGLLTIVLKQNLPIDIGELVASALRLFPAAKDEYACQIPGLFHERLNALLAEQGIRYDIAAAVMETSWQQPAQALVRASALAAFRDDPEFLRLVVGQKRVANILKGQTAGGLSSHGDCPQNLLLTEPTEQQLWNEARQVEPDLDRSLAAHDYQRAFKLLLGLRPTIDKFFEDVLVMAKEEEVRSNRLRLLAYVRSLFSKVADLSKIVIEGE